MCPWPWEPQQLGGQPIGMYHCPYCGEIVVAGLLHTDYRNLVEWERWRVALAAFEMGKQGCRPHATRPIPPTRPVPTWRTRRGAPHLIHTTEQR